MDAGWQDYLRDASLFDTTRYAISSSRFSESHHACSPEPGGARGLRCSWGGVLFHASALSRELCETVSGWGSTKDLEVHRRFGGDRVDSRLCRDEQRCDVVERPRLLSFRSRRNNEHLVD